MRLLERAAGDRLQSGDVARLTNAAARAVALIDRLTHHAEIIPIEGDRYRRRDALSRGALGSLAWLMRDLNRIVFSQLASHVSPFAASALC
jgi:hypothetical protein